MAAEERIPPPRAPSRWSDNPVRSVLSELGDIATFSVRAIGHAPGSLRYFAEILRQCSLLILGSTLVLLFLDLVIGSECALYIVYLTRPLGATDYTGFFEVPCGINELFPAVFAYAFAAKVGCGLVAEIGSMRISDEIDAMESIGLDPMRYVVGTRLLAVLVFVPLVYIACILAGVVGGYLTAVVQLGELTAARYWEGYWASQDLIDNLRSIVKTLSMALGIALVGMYYGFHARGGPVGVGNAVARSMIVNLVWIHFIGAVWSAVFFGHGARFPIGG